MSRSTAVAIGTTMLLLAGCASSGGGAGAADPARSSADSTGIPDDALVVGADALAGTSDNLLDVLMRELSSMQVVDPRMAGCPLVSFRGPVTGTPMSNPLVYVDGTRSSGTCLLTSLNSTSVQRVEIYPTGHTGRPGYVTHPHGLILIFMRSR